MSEQQWRAERDDRTLRYAGRRLDPARWIHVALESGYATTYAGQAATLTATTLLARMSPSVAVDIPDVRIVAPLPWEGQSLRTVALARMAAADPYGRFAARAAHPADYRISIGPSPSPFTVHGVGWDAFLGPGASPLAAATAADPPNPFGPAMAAVLAAARLFGGDFAPLADSTLVNAFDWKHAPAPLGAPSPHRGHLGTIWTAGAGSVGTAILFFVTLLTRDFGCAVVDMDFVKIHNLDRSPIFVDADVGQDKAAVVERFLREVGVGDVCVEVAPLHEATLWKTRTAGVPDVLVAAANEHNVRYAIESMFPPIQIYGTTGKNWQASVIRHTPLVDACSKCLFPREEGAANASLLCATDSGTNVAKGGGAEPDAALPFLSFAAGLMAASEIAKLPLTGFPYAPNRVTLYTHPAGELRLIRVGMPKVETCLCADRSENVHRKMIARTRYAGLSI